jgi:MFS family permease
VRTLWGTAVGPGLVWGLAVAGHELIQVVLPVHAAAFGVTLAWVGVLLSINKFIRVVGYGGVVVLGRWIGPWALMLVAAVASTLATFAYAVIDGAPGLLVVRLAWGLGFAALNLSVLMYATSVVERAGTNVGLNRAIGASTPALALALGSLAVLWLGPRDVFLAVGLFGALAIPIALVLPRLRVAEEPPGRRRLSRPTDIDVFFFVLGFTFDGLFIMTVALLFADRVSLEMAVVTGGLLLAARYVATIVVAPISGWLADRFGGARLQLLSGAMVVVGFAVIAAGFILVGCLLTVAARAALATLGNVVVAQRYGGGSMVALSRLATWTDFGGAVGPVAVGFLIPVFGLPPLYAAAAAILLVAVANVAWRSSGSPPQAG